MAAADREDRLTPHSVRGGVSCRYTERHSSSRSRRTASLAGFIDLTHVFDGPLR